MFKHVGKSIMDFADFTVSASKVLAIIGVVVGIIAAIAGEYLGILLYSIGAGLGLILVTRLNAMFIYAFGQLVDDVHGLKNFTSAEPAATPVLDDELPDL